MIDDSQYLMAFESFDHAKETGYGKFTNMALNFRNLIDFVVRKTPDDVIVYFLHHTERTDDGRLKAKTLGKMLDNQLTVEVFFQSFYSARWKGQNIFFYHKFRWQQSGKKPHGNV